MRKFFMTAFVLGAMLVFATSGLALEKTAMRTSEVDGWSSAGTSTCSIQYWNSCVGWVWTWSGWSPADVVGVCYQSCCGSGGTVNSMDIFTTTGAPPGYGFTGLLETYAADGDCCPTGAPTASVPALPPPGNVIANYPLGGSVGSSFVVAWTHGPGGSGPFRHVTDFAAQGPTGPQACGTCYPTTRVSNSFYYGTSTTLLCPGSLLNDGTCDTEFRWTANLTCGPVSVEDETWGGIKNLYR